jgi:hypothetical protein
VSLQPQRLATAPDEAQARLLSLAGGPRAIGQRHGEACAAAIHAFLADRQAQIGLWHAGGIAAAELHPRLEAHLACWRRWLPELVEELEGLAQGAGIDLHQAALLQLRRELIGYSALPSIGECSTIAARKTGSHPYAFLAQTVDLAGDLAPLARVQRICGRARGCPDILMFSFAGLLGYLGMNSAGLCVGINMILAGTWDIGVPPYLTVRRLLECRSVDECLEQLGRWPHASSRALTLMDERRLVVAEFAPHRLCVSADQEQTAHTNHILDARLAADDRINILSRNGSRRRLAVLHDYLQLRAQACAGDCAAADPAEALFALLSGHQLPDEGLCVHAGNNPRREHTVAAIVLQPQAQGMAVRFGTPCSAQTHRYAL